MSKVVSEAGSSNSGRYNTVRYRRIFAPTAVGGTRQRTALRELCEREGLKLKLIEALTEARDTRKECRGPLGWTNWKRGQKPLRKQE